MAEHTGECPLPQVFEGNLLKEDLSGVALPNPTDLGIICHMKQSCVFPVLCKYFKHKVMERKLINIENISEILNLLIKANKSTLIGVGWGEYTRKSNL